ncbi:MAG: hypothetical protein NTW29_05245 [Bacteroidetes bacterium]|nr:hypothetical protein [Bacteroidota bacterium]
MQWESTTAANNHEVYRLFNDGRQLLTLTLNPFSNAARVECASEKRIFLIRKEGFRRHKTVMCTEYGFRIGELGVENKQHFILVNNERIYYTIHNNPLAELVLYKETKDNPLVVCGLSSDNNKPGIYFSNENNSTQLPHPGLLMALCWYMFLPVAKENVVSELKASA